jgi:hypothetical protein
VACIGLLQLADFVSLGSVPATSCKFGESRVNQMGLPEGFHLLSSPWADINLEQLFVAQVAQNPGFLVEDPYRRVKQFT